MEKKNSFTHHTADNMTDNQASYPNFLIIGAGKSGTTTVNNALKQHPEIFICKVKEPNFFALEGETKIIGYDDEDPDGYFHYPQSITNRDDYTALFKDSADFKAVGECSNMYQYSLKARDNIKNTIPNVKLIGIFRNPVDRLFSRHLHLIRDNLSPTDDFMDCFDRASLWWKKNDLVREGMYFSHMKHYFDSFDRSQIKIMLYDDFLDNPTLFMQDIFKYLNVDDSFVPDLSIRYNVSGKIKNKWLDTIIGQESIIRRSIGWFSPKIVQMARDNHFLQKTIINMRIKNLEKPMLSKDVRKRLIDEIYHDEIQSFSQLIGRNLDHWLVP